MLGLSYPEAQVATWMNYDAIIPNILQKALKKLIMGALRKLMPDSRLLNRDLSAFNLKITFLFTKESGLTSLPMNTAMNTTWKPVSQILSRDWYATWIFKKKNLTEQFFGTRWVRSYDMRSWKMEEMNCLMTIGWTIFERDAVKRDFRTARTPATICCVFVLFKDTLGSDRAWADGSCRFSF